ncbi:MAG: hypothetical protein AAF530_04360 [Pseudomonadota bacterium]
MTGSACRSIVDDDNRREERVPLMGSACVNGLDFVLVDWSSSGFCASGYKGGLETKGRYALEMNVELEGAEYFFTCVTYIVRADKESGQVAGAFLEMDPEDRLAIAQFFDN